MNTIITTTDVSVKVAVEKIVYRDPNLKQSPFDACYENYIIDGNPNCEFVIGEIGQFNIFTKKPLAIVVAAGATPVLTLQAGCACKMFPMLGLWRAIEIKMLTTESNKDKDANYLSLV
jgi:hypothetical protein